MSDFDLINIGDDVAVGAGATITGHSIQGGRLIFKVVRLPISTLTCLCIYSSQIENTCTEEVQSLRLVFFKMVI